MNENNKTTQFIIRFVVVTLLNIIIKWGDESFAVFSGFNLRSISFSLFFIAYWLFIWYVELNLPIGRQL
jgi:hypothetical protein